MNMIWVVEPHADDAFLSVHTHIKEWIRVGERVGILTVYSTPARDAEGAAYAKLVGAQYLSLTVTEQSHLGLPPASIPLFSTWPIPNDDNTFVFPLGLQHPDHIQTRSQAPDGSWFYLDLPGQAKLKIGEQLLRKVRGRRIVSIRYASKRKWVAAKLFKTQSKFFYYNPPESLSRIPEIIVR